MRNAVSRRDVLVGATAALAGCNVLPKDDGPIEASADAPAVLPTGGEYTQVASSEVTVETTIQVDLSGDVQLSSQQDVTATVFQRVYGDGAGHRFGLLTAPAVTVVEQPEVVRDPLTAVDATRVVATALDANVQSVDGWNTDGSTTLLGTETTRERTTATVDGSERAVARARVRTGNDSVTAMATSPDDWTPPFGDVTRDA
ncbi:MAG: hypothetical protein ABEH83_02055 [Halobacterium sp.]